ncbi:MAG: hypothetical protein ACRCVE_06745, partial [Plesiomonas sp.]
SLIDLPIVADAITENTVTVVTDTAIDNDISCDDIAAEEVWIEVNPIQTMPPRGYSSAAMAKAPAISTSAITPVSNGSDWARPAYVFTGRGAAGSQAATHHAQAPAAKTGL